MTRSVLLGYYAATVLFLLLDFALGINLRLAFLEPVAGLRIAYYGFCFVCLALMLWRPAWTVFIAAFESLITLIALIFTMAFRTMIVTDAMIETGAGIVRPAEIVNFLIGGTAAYFAWVRGLREIRSGQKFPYI
ncbi:MAG: hypothetical protein KJO82_11135 [Gammaproteobacteria bacterium]|nr:hypothetical protein [Gammaproteobacteria bacterium]